MIRVTLICQLILQAIKTPNEGLQLISVDEKTSIQALERISASIQSTPGQVRRIEHEYKRQGSTCLMAAVDVGRGHIIHHRIHPTRTEEDFLLFIKQTVSNLDPNRPIVFMADQLNTHMSVSLVKWIAEQISFGEDLGCARRKGILKNMSSRKAFLEHTQHHIRFAYTPKHCSWLNPIENWFAKLQRHVIRFGNFQSVNELESKIRQYIEFYNKSLAKPLKWKFSGFTKDKMLDSICVKT